MVRRKRNQNQHRRAQNPDATDVTDVIDASDVKSAEADYKATASKTVKAGRQNNSPTKLTKISK